MVSCGDTLLVVDLTGFPKPRVAASLSYHLALLYKLARTVMTAAAQPYTLPTPFPALQVAVGLWKWGQDGLL